MSSNYIQLKVVILQRAKIYKEWFPKHKKYKQVPLAPDFAWYDARFEKISDDSEFDYYILIQEKTSLKKKRNSNFR